jgi:predicted HicB family RNase H-like nuclease
MKQTINIDESIWEKVNIEAKKRNISIDDLVKQALEVFLGTDTKKMSLGTV